MKCCTPVKYLEYYCSLLSLLKTRAGMRVSDRVNARVPVSYSDLELELRYSSVTRAKEKLP